MACSWQCWVVGEMKRKYRARIVNAILLPSFVCLMLLGFAGLSLLVDQSPFPFDQPIFYVLAFVFGVPWALAGALED